MYISEQTYAETNRALKRKVRKAKKEGAESMTLPTDFLNAVTKPCKVSPWKLMRDAADSLEAAEKRIAELEDDLRDGTISNPERFKIYDYTVKDLILFAELCKRNNVREEDIQQAAWNLELAVRAYALEREEIIKNTMDEIVARFTPDFEKAYEEMMPNCGAKMDGGKADADN